MLRQFVVILAFLALTAGRAVACTCSNGGPRNALRHSIAVFLGRVLSVSAGKRLEYGRVATARFIVTEAIKGPAVGDTAIVEYIIGDGGNCGIDVRPGQRLLVYAWPPRASGGIPVTDYCTGTKPLACAGFDLQQLGARVPSGAHDCRPSRPPLPERRDSSVTPAKHPDPPPNLAMTLTDMHRPRRHQTRVTQN